MRTKTLIAAFILIILTTAVELSGQNPAQYAPDRILVRFQDGIIPEMKTTENNPVYFNIPGVDELGKKYHCTGIRNLFPGKKHPGFPDIYQVQFKEPVNIKSVITDYLNTGFFLYAEPDFAGSARGHPATDSLMPNDTWFSRQWSLYNDGTFDLYPAKTDADIDMTEAWTIEQGDSAIIDAIIDSGCKLDHPELSGRIWTNSDEIPGNLTDDDGNGYVDDTRGWDFANDDNNPTDDEGHGTNIAGIIGANGNNSQGYAGVDWHCKLMVLKGLNSAGWGYYSWWISALHYAVDNGARVINMSLAGTDVSQALHDGIDYALQNDVAVIACMGNDNSNVTTFPAAYSGVIAVGATNPDDTRCNPFFWGGGSNYNTYISVVAPGNYIYGLDYLSNTNYGSYWGGTSQATPHVTGLYSLLLAEHPGWKPLQLRTAIESTAQDQVGKPSEDTPGWDKYFGYGRINARNALLFYPTFIPENKEPCFTVSPNPTTGRFRIYTGTQDNQAADIRIMDMTGRVIFTGNLNQKESLIDISDQAKGFYLVIINTEKGKKAEKLILQ